MEPDRRVFLDVVQREVAPRRCIRRRLAARHVAEHRTSTALAACSTRSGIRRRSRCTSLVTHATVRRRNRVSYRLLTANGAGGRSLPARGTFGVTSTYLSTFEMSSLGRNGRGSHSRQPSDFAISACCRCGPKRITRTCCVASSRLNCSRPSAPDPPVCVSRVGVRRPWELCKTGGGEWRPCPAKVVHRSRGRLFEKSHGLRLGHSFRCTSTYFATFLLTSATRNGSASVSAHPSARARWT